MTGNDIVDLRSANFPDGTRGPRFLQKIFSPGEVALIRKDQAGMWALWAMKEAVYKAHQRRFKRPRSFDPKNIHLRMGNIGANHLLINASYHGYDYIGSGIETPDYIHFTATCHPREKIFQEIFSSSVEIKTKLKLEISKKTGLVYEDLEVVKDSNFIPHLKYQNSLLRLPFSISHHGNFAAFSFQLMNY